MKTIRAFIERHPVLSYYAMVFAISWGGILIAVGLGPGGFSATPQQFQMSVPYAVPAMILGPGVAGIFMTTSSTEGPACASLDLGCSSGVLALGGTR